VRSRKRWAGLYPPADTGLVLMISDGDAVTFGTVTVMNSGIS